jgi:hypothetical protein
MRRLLRHAVTAVLVGVGWLLDALDVLNLFR